MNQPAPVVVVTGAAGQLGRAVATAFAHQGAHPMLVDRNAGQLEALGASLPNATVVAVDLLQREQVVELLEGALKRAGRVDALCHLAGGFRMGEAVHETTAGNWDFLFDLNARSLVNVAAAVVPRMLAQRSGRIVTVGAAAALRGGGHMGAYSASKSALMRLTEAMSAELRDQGINVNCVLPSTLDTPPNRAAMPDADSSRWVTPQALADVITFLASDAARAIHGAMIPVYGRAA